MKYLLGLATLVLLVPLGAQKPGEIRMTARELTQQQAANVTPQVAWLFDDLNTPTQSLTWAKKGALAVLAQAPSGSRWAILTTSGSLHQAFTSDQAQLESVLQKLSSHAEAIDSTNAVSATGLTIPMHSGGNSDESLQNHSARSLDAIGAAVTYCATQPGITDMVVVSNGFAIYFPANGTNLANQVRQLDQSAAQAGVVVNAIDPAVLVGGSWQDKEVVLSGLAQATSGLLVDNTNQLASAFRRLSSPSSAQKTAAQALERALAGSKFDELPMEVVPQRWQATPASPSGARLVVVVSPRGLSFEHSHGIYHQHLRVAAVLVNAQGVWVAGQEGNIVLNLSGQTLQKLNKVGIQAALNLPAAPGKYRLLVVGQELRGGHTTSLVANVTLH